MKNTVLLAFFFVLSIKAFSQEWRYITSSKDNSSKYYMKPQISKNETTVKVWEKNISNKTNYFDGIGNTVTAYNTKAISLKEYNCSNNQNRFLTMNIYNENGDVIKKVDYPSKWTIIFPDTIGEVLYNYVCAKNN